MAAGKTQRLKIWRDWSDGVGFLDDSPDANGLYYASGILGMLGELRPAPLKNTVAVGIDSSRHFQYFFEEPVATANPVFDASSSGSTNNVNTLTVSHTIANQPNQVLFVWVFVNSTLAWFESDLTITFNGDTLINAVDEAYSSSFAGILYYLPNPDIGAHDIVATVSNGGTADIILIAASYYKTSQTAPIRATFSADGLGTSIAKTGIVSSTSEIMVMGSATPNNLTDTQDGAETLIATILNAGNDMRSTASSKVGAASGSMTHTLSGAGGAWISLGGSIVGAAPGPSHLYAMSGGRVGNTSCFLDKFDLFNSAFATQESGFYALTNLLKTGQPTRYQGFWWIPDGDEFDPRKLTPATGGCSGELAASSAWTGGGADHLGNMNGQMIAGLKDNGYAILSVNGTPTTTADWGSYFTVGDKNERPAAISGLSGLSFVLTVEGLLSFNTQGRSGLIFEDFRSWRNVFDNIPMPSWRGGLLIPHPTGLLYYTPGEIPVNIGIEAKSGVGSIPPSGATELHGGRYMGVHATGDYVWAVYQPLLSSTAALILCGYSKTRDPRNLTWQVVSTTTLQDAQHLLGIFVSAQSQPNSSTYNTPCVWYGDTGNLSYNILDPRAGPFRSRTDTHKVITSGNAFLSEITLPEPMDLDRVTLVVQDMAAGDEWQISAIINNDGNDINLGAPIVGDGWHSRPFGVRGQNVYRIMFHLTWIATSSSARVPPTIRLMELWGSPPIA